MDDELSKRRLAVVREHMEAENRQDFDAVIATFAHPRYELMASGEVFDGEEEVRGYFAASRSAFPDQRNENADLHAADGMVVAEFDLVGTLKDSDRAFRSRMVALFIFDGDFGGDFDGDGIVCERVYFDRRSIAEQLKA